MPEARTPAWVTSHATPDDLFGQTTHSAPRGSSALPAGAPNNASAAPALMPGFFAGGAPE